MPTRKEIVEAVLEVKDVLAIEMKNPRFIKTEDLQEILIRTLAEDVDIEQFSPATLATLESLKEEASDTTAVQTTTEDGTESAGEEEVKQEVKQLPADLKSREALNIAALDMNDVMGLEPGIDTGLDDALFMKAFIKASKMATGTDNFTEFTWRVLAANDLGPERVISKPIKAKTDKATAKSSGKTAKPKETKAPKPGVIAAIKDFLIERHGQSKPFSRDEIWKVLTEKFPERDADALMSTIRTQVPGRLSKEAGFVFEPCQEKGSYKVTKLPA